MSISTSTNGVGKGVVLLRLGEGVQEFDLPPDATLADLLRESGANLAENEVMIDGRPIEEAIVLRPGMIVSLSPKPEPPAEVPWRKTVGMFRDDPYFDAMMDDVMAAREAETAGR